MKRLAAAGIAWLIAFGISGSGATPFVRGPYSGAPSQNSVVISWVVSPPLPALLEVSPIDRDSAEEKFPLTLDVAAPTEEDKGQVDAFLGCLEPATSYAYRVTIQSGSELAMSPLGYFKTAPAPGQPTTFAVLADTQWQWEGMDRLAVIGDAVAFDSARSGGFDFVLHAGDLVETPNAYYWNPWFSSFGRMLLAAPFLPVLGNHEKNSITYYNAFAHPPGAGQGGERWWTLRWGDIIVVGLDTSVNRADQILEQQAYVRAQLAGPERWKFVIFHHPVFTSDAYYSNDDSYERIYHPIFVEAGVNLVFNGHAHNYERIERDGVTYLVLGGGGATPTKLAPTRVDGSVVAMEGRNFYARVSVSPSGICVEVVSVAAATDTRFVPTPARLLDSFFLPALDTSAQESAAEVNQPVVAAAPALVEAPLPPAGVAAPEGGDVTAAQPSQSPRATGIGTVAILAALLLLATIGWTLLHVQR